MPVWPPWLAEAQGEPLLGIGQGLSLEGRVSNSHRATVSPAGQKIEMVAIVTPGFKPFTVKGTAVRQVEGLRST